MESLHAALLSMISISEEEMEYFLSHCEIRSFKKKAYLNEVGRPTDEVFFIQKGLLRVMITDLGGTEHTSHFACLLYTSPSPRDA